MEIFLTGLKYGRENNDELTGITSVREILDIMCWVNLFILLIRNMWHRLYGFAWLGIEDSWTLRYPFHVTVLQKGFSVFIFVV